ncbi:MAG TPA: Bax inhibitor-1/YccA family protein [Alphaproteobacteria bacterium]|nr:Bax inhibitor-1/YccA family protein [Alphaproteobacteria bacterium]
MDMDIRQQGRVISRAVDRAEIDEGLRSYMLRVYNYMASGLALTGIVAYLVSQSPAAMHAVFGTPLFWLVVLAPLGLVFFLSARINRMQASTAQALFWVYAALMGVSLASIFVVYTGTNIARVFFISAGAFAGLSLYGYTTRRDLSGMASFLMVGLIGVIIASLVNMFLHSTGLQFALSVIGVLVFAGLTAYDTQSIKEMYFANDMGEVATKKSVLGALRLYLDFLNLFLLLLQLFGNQRN